MSFDRIASWLWCVIVVWMSSCRWDGAAPSYRGYPDDIGKILIPRCATSGCHNSASAAACADLDLSSWESLFKGSRYNSSVIPFRPDHSFLLFSVNTFDDLGPKLTPTMPVNNTPLTREEVTRIRNWIRSGAPDHTGLVKFSGNSHRKKIYVANQGCDLITVFDTESKLVMRAFDAGNTGDTEAPHDMTVSPDGNHLYISFYASNLFQKFRTTDEVKTGELLLPDNSWHSLAISGDSKIGITSHLEGSGKVTLVDLEKMEIIAVYQGTNLLANSHGCALNYDGTVAYITSQQGNFIYKADLSDPQNPDFKKVILQPGEIASFSGIYKPYEVDYFPDFSRYAVTCQGTNEVRIFDAAKDSLLKVIKATGVPQLTSFSKKLPYLFVSCMEDSANGQTVSSVDVVNYYSLTYVTSVTTGYQPRGISADDNNGVVWVANRNISPVGWVPHHTTACKGKNGYITLIDMNTLQLVPKWKTEVSVDPYCISRK